MICISSQDQEHLDGMWRRITVGVLTYCTLLSCYVAKHFSNIFFVAGMMIIVVLLFG